ncbi:DUF4374 domain-containing protein [Sphingobacterium sp. LRF_L2]|uniref:DUF4374 domain-containing protein n=1 Tax=Sphingobacterium sp. LRF_L2 TaxID=3369421 RepID=UPI003F5DC2F8
MYKFQKSSLMVGVAMLLLSACDSKKVDTPEPDTGNPATDSQYIITARQSSDNVEGPSYLLQTTQIDAGTISLLNNGWQADQNGGTADGSIWFYPNEKAAYHYAYRRGPSDVTSYYLDTNGQLGKGTIEYQIEEGQGTFGVWEGKMVTITGHVDAGKAYTDVHFFDPETKRVVNKNVATSSITGDEENFNVYFAGVVGKGDKFYSSVVGSEDYEVTDKVRIVEFDENLNTRLIVDDRLSYSGGRFRSILFSQIDMNDNGDLYVFSSSFEKTDKPSGVLRIKNGEQEFDPDFYINFDQLTQNRSVYKVWYVGGDNFLIQTYTETAKSQEFPDMKRLGILNVSTKTFKWVTGIPQTSVITRIANAPLLENGQVILPITSSTAYPYVYKIDPETAVATRGVQIQAGSIVGIGKLTK